MPQIQDGLRRLDVAPKAFKAKFESVDGRVCRAGNYLAIVEPLAAHAFAFAVSAGHDFIKPADIFFRTSRDGEERFNRLFSLFNIEEGRS